MKVKSAKLTLFNLGSHIIEHWDNESHVTIGADGFTLKNRLLAIVD